MLFKNNILVFSTILGFSLASCQENPDMKEEPLAERTDSTTISPILISSFSESPTFPNATLKMGKVSSEVVGDSVKLSFNFDVANYELKNQTDDAVGKQCSNSDKGQHIHFIMDNKSYVALYEPKHEITLAKNTEHYLLCFLSRSYHESLKNKEASVLYHFKIDEKGKLVKLDNPTAPMIFYSRPKGDYIGKDATNVLLDFYVWNASLGANYTVSAAFKNDRQDTTVVLNEWKAYQLSQLKKGINKITLTLMDKNGKKVESPQAEVTREFQLADQEPMK